MIVIGIGILLVAGCGKKEAAPAEPPAAEVHRAEIKVGDSYSQVLEELGKPNIESKTQNSLVLIYDDIEVKLQSNVVIEVFDHRGE